MNRDRIAALEDEYLDEHPGTAGTVEPFVFTDPEDPTKDYQPALPVLTDMLLSDEWEVTGVRWFIYSSGCGRDDEPALTMEQFKKALEAYVREHPNHGFGLSGVGQFQVYVSAYRRRSKHETRA